MLKYLMIAAIVQTVWGLTPSASNLVIQHFPVELYTTLRWTISGLIFLSLVFIKDRKLIVNRSYLPKLALLGILGYGVASLGTLYGLKLGGVVNFALVGSISPIVTASVAIFILKEKITRKFVIAAVTCVSGLLILVFGKFQISTLSIATLSTLLIFGAYILEALPFSYSKKFKSKTPLLHYMAILQISAALFMWGCELAFFQQSSAVLEAPIEAWGALIFVSVVACVICYLSLYWLLNFIEGHKLALFDGVHTVSAATFGVIFYNETFNSLMLVGGTLIIGSIFLANYQPKKRRKIVTIPEPLPT